MNTLTHSLTHSISPSLAHKEHAELISLFVGLFCIVAKSLYNRRHFCLSACISASCSGRRHSVVTIALSLSLSFRLKCCKPVRPSVCTSAPPHTSAHPRLLLKGSMWNLILGSFMKINLEISYFTKIGHFTWRSKYALFFPATSP